jgi:hypothetical protein
MPPKHKKDLGSPLDYQLHQLPGVTFDDVAGVDEAKEERRATATPVDGASAEIVDNEAITSAW